MADEGEKATLWGTPMGARFSEGPELSLPFVQASGTTSSSGSSVQASASHVISSTPASPPVSPSGGPLVGHGPTAESAVTPPPQSVPAAAVPASQPSGAASSSSQLATAVVAQPTASVLPAVPALDAPSLYVNRELSWLEFNARVLAEVEDPSVPLYERIKFLSIVTANLDEFFMVRVAGLKQQLSGEVEEVPPDGRVPQEQLAAVSARAHTLVDVQYRCWNESLVPALHREGVMLVKPGDLAPEELAALDASFKNDIFPVLTPIAIDPGHPFPHLRNKSLNLGVMFARDNVLEPGFGVVQVPS